MVSGVYIFAKVMVMNIFMSVKQNREAGEGRINETVEENFKMIGSILYYLFMQVINDMMDGYNRIPDT